MTTKDDKSREHFHGEHDVLNVMGEAYEKLYEDVAENLHHAEENTEKLFHQYMHQAKDKIKELKQISEEDADKVAAWVKRDMEDAAHYLSDSGNELQDWFGFETALVENKLLDMFTKAADKTTMELLKFKEKSIRDAVYRTGEVTGPATLKCDACGEILQFRRAGKIPPCPKCHETRFHRVLK